MATAISYKSESGDDYLSLFQDDNVTIEKIVETDKSMYDMEFAYLYVVCVQSSNLDVKELEQALVAEIEEADQE